MDSTLEGLIEALLDVWDGEHFSSDPTSELNDVAAYYYANHPQTSDLESIEHEKD